jgi:hypothetical protein
MVVPPFGFGAFNAAPWTIEGRFVVALTLEIAKARSPGAESDTRLKPLVAVVLNFMFPCGLAIGPDPGGGVPITEADPTS